MTDKVQPSDLDHYQNPQIEDRSIRWLKTFFERKFSGDNWKDFEPEMLAYELSLDYPEKPLPLDTLKKIFLLKALEEDPARFYTDPVFLLHAVEILNNTSHSSSDSLPSVTSLELAYAVNLVGSMYPHDATTALKKTCEYVLREEGYTTAPYPFTFLDSDVFEKTESKKDEEDKKKALNAYLRLQELKDK